ncbi:MAG: 30S ribosomal protein S20 [Thermostichales cyanobacterium SZTDM-1c_bins_54]
MPQIKSAIKRVKIAERNRLRNKATKSAVRTLSKKALAAIAKLQSQQASLEEVQKAMSLAYSRIDKAVKTGVLHPNTGARRKARLARNLNKVIAPASPS